jgi:hypothetical protein
MSDLEKAFGLVGRFLYHFGRLEEKINQAGIKLLGLDKKAGPVVQLIPLVRRISLVKNSACSQAKNEGEEKHAKDTCDRIAAMNDYRNIIAHSPFDASGADVQFRKAAVSKDGQFKPIDPPWTEADFSNRYTEMTALETELDKLIGLIEPIPIDLLNSWQEMYHRSSSAFYPGAATAARLLYRGE